MNRSLEIVVLSRYPEIFDGFAKSVESLTGRGGVVVWDAATIVPEHRHSWLELRRTGPFSMSKNANWGFNFTDSDVLYCGDDIRFSEIDTIEAIQGAAYTDTLVGILSPKIIGHAQEQQMRPTNSPLTYVNWVSFPCVYIKREVFDEIGYFDEDYSGYGFEDLDFCFRARRAGFKIAVAAEVAVRHGVNGLTYGSTFRRVKTEEQMGKENNENLLKFAVKWGLKNDARAVFEAMERVPATESRRW